MNALMTLEKAQQVWKSRTAVEVEDMKDGLPVFNASKGGRFWIDGYVKIDMLEALVVLGRHQVPDDEIGFRWYRQVFDDEQQQRDDSPMTEAEAKEVLEEKRNGYYHCLPRSEQMDRYPALETETLEIVGETVIEELEALLLLWRAAIQSKTKGPHEN